jgi:DNA-binding GntR family transcriptional regulator
MLKIMDENLAAQGKALRAGNLEQFYDLDEALHAAIFGAIEKPRALRLLEAARAPLDRVRRLALPEICRPEQTFAEHRALVEAIRSGDGEYAAAAMRAHLMMVGRAIEQKLPEIEAKQG